MAKQNISEKIQILLNHFSAKNFEHVISNGKILIYRKEEWKKVLIHELFHSLCLDFSGIRFSTQPSDDKFR